MIVNNAHLATSWSSQPFIEGALLAFEGKTIVDFGPVGKLIDRYDDPDVLDAAGRLVVPGFINAHTRLDRSFVPGAPVSAGFPRSSREARESLYRPLERALDPDALYWSAMSGLLDAVRAGVTTAFVFAPLTGGSAERLEPLERAIGDVGVRAVLVAALSLDSPPKALGEAIDWVERRRTGGSELLTPVLGLEDAGDLDEPTIADAVEAARSARASFHVVLAEDAEDLERCRSRWGMTPAARLDRLGVWGEGGVAVRGAACLPEEEEVLRRSDVFLAHCPEADRLGTGDVSDLMKLASSRLRLAVGTKGVGQSVARELLVSTLQQRSIGRTTNDAVRLAYQAAVTGNAELATSVLGRSLGRIKPGARADLVVTDYRPPSPVEERNLADHYFWGVARSPVLSVIVNGMLLYHNGGFLALDEERVRARAREAARAAWERM